MRWKARLAKISIGLGVVGLVLGFLSGVGALAYFAESFPSWTGFGLVPEYDAQREVTGYVAAKTLWDWLNLLLVPLVLTGGGIWFTRSENRQARELEQNRVLEHRRIEEERLKEARELEAQRIEEARELERDRAEDTIVQEYLDQMTDLLLSRGLRNSSEDDEVRSVARARTLMVLRGVNGMRRATIAQFLYEARLLGYFYGIETVDAVVQMYQAKLVGAFLYGANLSGASLERVDLQRANLQRAKLSEANLQRANLYGANLQRANLYGANLQWVNLLEANLGGANLGGANLDGANLQRVNLVGASLYGASLYGANLREAKLVGAGLGGANLGGANLPEAKFLGSSLKQVDLQRANLVKVNLYNTELYGANLSGATFDGANLTRCRGLTTKQLLQACSLSGAILPNYINPTDLGDLWSPPKSENTPEPQP